MEFSILGKIPVGPLIRLPHARPPRWSPTVSAPLMTEGLDGGNNKNNNFLSALETCRLEPDPRRAGSGRSRGACGGGADCAGGAGR